MNVFSHSPKKKKTSSRRGPGLDTSSRRTRWCESHKQTHSHTSHTCAHPASTFVPKGPRLNDKGAAAFHLLCVFVDHQRKQKKKKLKTKNSERAGMFCRASWHLCFCGVFCRAGACHKEQEQERHGAFETLCKY